MAVTIGASTSPDLVKRLDVTVEELARAGVAGSVGGVLGALCGTLLDRFHSHGDFLFGILLVLSGVLTTLMPLFPLLSVYIFLSFCSGFTWTNLNAGMMKN